MYKHFENMFSAEGDNRSVLSISHSEELCQVMGLRKETLTIGNYPDVDILKLPYEDGTFDFVVSDQVLEHVGGPPERAIQESYRVLKPGGIAVHTTCLINPIHAAPSDYWRFTPDALKLLCQDFSEHLDVGSWGNQWLWVFVWLGMRHDGVPETHWHPYHLIATMNDPEWAINTWIVARK